MPHFTIEYSANLESAVDMPEFCAAILSAALETGVFEVGAVRVRAIRSDAYAIADQLPENGFIDMSLRMGAGRSKDAKKAIGEAVFAAAEAFLQPQFATPHFALSFEIREIDPDLSWKKNTIHPRLRSGS